MSTPGNPNPHLAAIDIVGPSIPSGTLKELNKRMDETGDRLAARFNSIDDTLYEMLQMMKSIKAKVDTFCPDPSDNLEGSEAYESVRDDGEFDSGQGSTTIITRHDRHARYTGNKRLPDGSLNLQRVAQGISGLPMTGQETQIQSIWPQVTLPQEAKKLGETQSKNKVNISAGLRLVRADDRVFDKLGQIQTLLKIALVPYKLWASRVALELSGDFHQYCKGIKL
ncbi:uncharacterized protein BCR38DRAFT_481533 [Pseudomassariella vexata]|uniref:Uncharacterized protein n=1 Tax=Pseudomassariella vexata TaxID=1141098 RepID=A0A1Y2EFQ9_9PEZI|nr:uncharacterized protein BCR38DRAFT_481533 [Pseudomassariella vexata]ORY70399.1 hypothetical protein BCR38DRAFT_481533 [Pseudomassariella vexata]